MAEIVLRRDGFFDLWPSRKSSNKLYNAKVSLMHRLLEANHFNPSYESLLNSISHTHSDGPFVGNPFVGDDGYSIYIKAKGLHYPVYYIGKIMQ